MTERTQVIVEIDEPLGPGVEFDRNVDGIGSTARRARVRGPWLGLDRGHLVEADDGSGRQVPVLVALPASTFVGCRIEGELVGGLAAPAGAVLVARIMGGAIPIEAFIRTAAGRVASEGEWIDAPTAARIAERSRREFRERRAKERVVGGRAWLPEGSEAPPQARFSTPHSLSEYSLTRLPPRFVRGLEGMLDPDERILYWIDRPASVDPGLVERVRLRRDRRAALLLLTDRQVAWLVDHATPDRYLSDWGVDVVSLPNEQLVDVAVATPRGETSVTLRTARGTTEVRLPRELSREAAVFRDLASGFASRSSSLPRRRYDTEEITPDWALLETLRVRGRGAPDRGRPRWRDPGLACEPAAAGPGPDRGAGRLGPLDRPHVGRRVGARGRHRPRARAGGDVLDAPWAHRDDRRGEGRHDLSVHPRRLGRAGHPPGTTPPRELVIGAHPVRPRAAGRMLDLHEETLR